MRHGSTHHQHLDLVFSQKLVCQIQQLCSSRTMILDLNVRRYRCKQTDCLQMVQLRCSLLVVLSKLSQIAHTLATYVLEFTQLHAFSKQYGKIRSMCVFVKTSAQCFSVKVGAIRRTGDTVSARRPSRPWNPTSQIERDCLQKQQCRRPRCKLEGFETSQYCCA